METVLFIPPSQVHPAVRAVASPEQMKGITKRVQVWLCILVVLSPLAYVSWSIKNMADERQDIANTNTRSTNYERFKAEAERNAAIRAEEYQEWVRKLEGHQETNHP
jgi:predicted negative regulator of RcsB-dependent stress response